MNQIIVIREYLEVCPAEAEGKGVVSIAKEAKECANKDYLIL